MSSELTQVAQKKSVSALFKLLSTLMKRCAILDKKKEVCVDLRINIIAVTLSCLHHQTVSHRNAGSVSAEIRFLYGSPIVEPSDIAHE